MATTKLGNTKSASKSINYAEKRATVKSGHNCDVNYAKSNFKELRLLYGKDDGIQAHTIIQSFKPGEVTSKKANEIGLELAKKAAPNHQVAVYTHTDKDHIHNHIVINSVNLESGKKYQSNAAQRHFIKRENDRICLKNGLSVVTEKSVIRHTLAEQELLKQGQSSWKDEIRQAVDISRKESSSFEQMQQQLANEFNIQVHLRGQKTVTFEHPNGKKSRGNKLGNAYERGTLENEFTRKVEAKRESSEVQRTLEPNRKNEGNRTTKRTDSRENESTDRTDEQYLENNRDHEREPQPRIKQDHRGLEL